MSLSASLSESLEDCLLYDGATPAVTGDVGSFSESFLRMDDKLADDTPDCVLSGEMYRCALCCEVASGDVVGADDGGAGLAGVFAPGDS